MGWFGEQCGNVQASGIDVWFSMKMSGRFLDVSMYR